MRSVLFILAFLTFANLSANSQNTYFEMVLIDLATQEAVDFNTIYDDYGLDSSKPTFVITWSGEWCFPCIRLIERYNDCVANDINLITINVDTEDDRDDVLAEGYQNGWNNAINFHAARGDDYRGFDNVFNVSSAPLVLLFKDESLDVAMINYSMYPYRMVQGGIIEVGTIWSSSDDLNSLAWDVYGSDESTLTDYEEAITWINRSIELETNYSNVDTHAALLYKTGEYTLALKEAKKAIELAKANEDDYESTSELIQLIIDKL